MILADSNFWIATVAKNDSLHSRAKADFEDALRGREKLVLNELVVAEVATVLDDKHGRQHAADFLDFVANAEDILLQRVDDRLLRLVLAGFRTAPAGLSFTDYALLAQHRELGARLLTYDEKLAKAARKH